MALESRLSEELQEVWRRIEVLAAQRDEARRQLDETRTRLEKTEDELGKAREELRLSKLDTEFLVVSRRLADSPQALANARNTLKRLIAKVDKAISLLEEDAAL